MDEALVLKSTGKWYTLELSTGQIVQGRIRGKLRLEGLSTTNPIAAGDKVFLLPDVDAEGIRLIDNIVPRKNYLVRKSTNLSKQMQILAANIDHAYLVVTLKSPVTQIAFIDRFLVSADWVDRIMADCAAMPPSCIASSCCGISRGFLHRGLHGVSGGDRGTW